MRVNRAVEGRVPFEIHKRHPTKEVVFAIKPPLTPEPLSRGNRQFERVERDRARTNVLKRVSGAHVIAMARFRERFRLRARFQPGSPSVTPSHLAERVAAIKQGPPQIQNESKVPPRFSSISFRVRSAFGAAYARVLA